MRLAATMTMMKYWRACVCVCLPTLMACYFCQTNCLAPANKIYSVRWLTNTIKDPPTLLGNTRAYQPAYLMVESEGKLKKKLAGVEGWEKEKGRERGREREREKVMERRWRENKSAWDKASCQPSSMSVLFSIVTAPDKYKWKLNWVYHSWWENLQSYSFHIRNVTHTHTYAIKLASKLRKLIDGYN